MSASWEEQGVNLRKIKSLLLDFDGQTFNTHIQNIGPDVAVVAESFSLGEMAHDFGLRGKDADGKKNAIRLEKKQVTRKINKGFVSSIRVSDSLGGSFEFDFNERRSQIVLTDEVNGGGVSLSEGMFPGIKVTVFEGSKFMKDGFMEILGAGSAYIDGALVYADYGSLVVPFKKGKNHRIKIGDQTLKIAISEKKLKVRKNRFVKWSTASALSLGLAATTAYQGSIYYLREVYSQKFVHPAFQIAGLEGPFVIKASDGTRVNEFDPPSPYIPFESIDPKVIALLILSEDEEFYVHEGFDPESIASALVKNLLAGETLSGASTITQQLARSLDTEQVGNAKSNKRKIDEIAFAMSLERALSKEEILARYIQIVNTGYTKGLENLANLYGISIYKGQGISWLDAARLIVSLQAPSVFRPETEANKKRVLKLLTKANAKGVLTDEEIVATAEMLELQPLLYPNPIVSRSKFGPYATSQIWTDLNEINASLPKGSSIYEQDGNITVDSSPKADLQKGLQKIVTRFVGRSRGVSQGAVTIANAKTGSIVATVGGVNPETDRNPRQSYGLTMASTFKMIDYAAYLEQYPNTSRGYLRTLGNAFARSYNGVALSLVRSAGPENVAKLAVRLGLDPEAVYKKEREGLNPIYRYKFPGYALGQDSASVNEMAQVGATIFNKGKLVEVGSIDKVFDNEGCNPYSPEDCARLIWSRKTSAEQPQVLSEFAARNVKGFMRQGASYGTGDKLSRQPYSWAYTFYSKTGTSDQGRSLRLVVVMEPNQGFSDLEPVVISIWLGNDDYSPTGKDSFLAVDLATEVAAFLNRAYFKK